VLASRDDFLIETFVKVDFRPLDLNDFLILRGISMGQLEQLLFREGSSAHRKGLEMLVLISLQNLVIRGGNWIASGSCNLCDGYFTGFRLSLELFWLVPGHFLSVEREDRVHSEVGLVLPGGFVLGGKLDVVIRAIVRVLSVEHEVSGGLESFVGREKHLDPLVGGGALTRAVAQSASVRMEVLGGSWWDFSGAGLVRASEEDCLQLLLGVGEKDLVGASFSILKAPQSFFSFIIRSLHAGSFVALDLQRACSSVGRLET